MISSSPEYLICVNCETPIYVFEWQSGKVVDVLCPVCGSEEPTEFLAEDEYEAMAFGHD